MHYSFGDRGFTISPRLLGHLACFFFFFFTPKCKILNTFLIMDINDFHLFLISICIMNKCFIHVSRRHQSLFKTDQQHSHFSTEYFRETLLRPLCREDKLILAKHEKLFSKGMGRKLSKIHESLLETPSSTRKPPTVNSRSGSVSCNSDTICRRWRRVFLKYLVQECECLLVCFQLSLILHHWKLKGCGMGTLFILVSPCFRENVVFTCKIGSFLCSLHNLLQKNIIVFFFGNQISKWRSFEKKGYFWHTFHSF